MFHHALEYRYIYLIFSNTVPNIKLLTDFLSLRNLNYIEYFLTYTENLHFISFGIILHFKICKFKVFKEVVSYSYYILIKNYIKDHSVFTTNHLLIVI